MRMVSQYTLEYRAAVFTMLWGLWLIFGNETSLDATAFSYLKSTVDSVAFHSIPTHISLGIAAFSVGALYIIAIAINGQAILWTPITRLLCAGFNVALFATVAYSIAKVDFWSPGAFTYFAISCGFLSLFIANISRVETSVGLLWRRLNWKIF